MSTLRQRPRKALPAAPLVAILVVPGSGSLLGSAPPTAPLVSASLPRGNDIWAALLCRCLQSLEASFWLVPDEGDTKSWGSVRPTFSPDRIRLVAPADGLWGSTVSGSGSIQQLPQGSRQSCLLVVGTDSRDGRSSRTSPLAASPAARGSGLNSSSGSSLSWGFGSTSPASSRGSSSETGSGAGTELTSGSGFSGDSARPSFLSRQDLSFCCSSSTLCLVTRFSRWRRLSDALSSSLSSLVEWALSDPVEDLEPPSTSVYRCTWSPSRITTIRTALSRGALRPSSSCLASRYLATSKSEGRSSAEALRVLMGPPRMPRTSLRVAPSVILQSCREDSSGSSWHCQIRCCWDTGMPSSLDILVLMETTVSAGETSSSKAVPCKVSMNTSITLLLAIAERST
uniref:Putative secreted protein n=1 Tax=Ixodes ricinus TaxID=34613 RepID=A0A147BAH3_IXORI